jgi:hypothetical protein
MVLSVEKTPDMEKARVGRGKGKELPSPLEER